MNYHHSDRLTEGMREGDLADLVLPLISVDEFVSKVDEDEAIVFGFYVHDESAADDLNRFLQKSPVQILDTEVSPAPDQRGYFMVFVELTKNDRLAENVSDILSEIKGLVDIDEWQMRIRDLDDLVPFSEQALKHSLLRVANKVTEHMILEFLQPSVLDNAIIEDGLLILQGSGERFVFDVVGFDRIDRLMQQKKLTETAISYNLRNIARTNRIARILGDEWQVFEIDQYMMIHQADDLRGLLLR